MTWHDASWYIRLPPLPSAKLLVHQEPDQEMQIKWHQPRCVAGKVGFPCGHVCMRPANGSSTAKYIPPSAGHEEPQNYCTASLHIAKCSRRKPFGQGLLRTVSFTNGAAKGRRKLLYIAVCVYANILRLLSSKWRGSTHHVEWWLGVCAGGDLSTMLSACTHTSSTCCRIICACI